MTQEENLGKDADGFENGLNMVPGEVESANQLDPTGKPVARKGNKAQLLFVLAAFLFAGGWVYANQDDFKSALGIETQGGSHCALKTANGELHACTCPHATAAAQEEGCEGECPLAAQGEGCEGGNGCQKGQKNALVDALLDGAEKEDSPAKEAGTEEKSAPAPTEGASEEAVAVEESSKEEVKETTEEKTEVKPEVKSTVVPEAKAETAPAK